MTDSHPHPRKPTAKQLRYLRDLALKTGQSFAYPRTATEASREIDRLKKQRRTPAADRRRELREIGRDMAGRCGGSSRIEPDLELQGYRSTAAWSASVADDAEERRKEAADAERASSWR